MRAVTLNFYGRLTDRFGTRCLVELPPEGCTVAQLKGLLADAHEYAEIASPGVRAAIGDTLVPEDVLLRPGDEVDFLAPLSGG